MKPPPPVWRRILPALLILLAALSGASASMAQELPAPGLDTVRVPATGSYFLRYMPPGLTPGQPVPVIVFFHGSGGRPFDYIGYLTEAARQAGGGLGGAEAGDEPGGGGAGG